MGQRQLFRETKPWLDFVGCISCLYVSILLFAWHLHTFYAGQHLLHIILFYPINVTFLFGVLYGCKLLNNYRSAIITNLSIGTLVIIGLHIALITIANFTFEHLLHINYTICYQWYEATPITLIIIVLLYPIILFGEKHTPILLGRKKRWNIWNLKTNSVSLQRNCKDLTNGR